MSQEPIVTLTMHESEKATHIAARLRLSEDAQKQIAARAAFLGELERLCRMHNKRLPLAVLRHVYRAHRSSDAVRFELATQEESRS